MNQRIAIVEDDEDQRNHYASALREHGYEVIEYADTASAIDGAAQAKPDLAILDIILGDDVGGGFEVCRALKASEPALPVIFLTSRGNELDKIYGLQMGAWDYQTKPVSLEFLLARIRSLFLIKKAASPGAAASDCLTHGDLSIYKGSMRVCWTGEKIDLTPTEYEILSAIIANPDGVSMEQLSRSTRQGIVEDNTINTHILHIRKKFKRVDPEFACIKARYGFGYSWVC